MSTCMLPPERDPIAPGPTSEITITVDGARLGGVSGQSIAGLMLAAGQIAWRTTPVARRPRGLFCGIGVCFDCLVTVNGLPDVRACQRVARDGDVVETQREAMTQPQTDATAGGAA